MSPPTNSFEVSYRWFIRTVSVSFILLGTLHLALCSGPFGKWFLFTAMPQVGLVMFQMSKSWPPSGKWRKYGRFRVWKAPLKPLPLSLPHYALPAVLILDAASVLDPLCSCLARNALLLCTSPTSRQGPLQVCSLPSSSQYRYWAFCRFNNASGWTSGKTMLHYKGFTTRPRGSWY